MRLHHQEMCSMRARPHMLTDMSTLTCLRADLRVCTCPPPAAKLHPRR